MCPQFVLSVEKSDATLTGTQSLGHCRALKFVLVLVFVGDVSPTFVAIEFDVFESESFKSGQFFVPQIFVTLFATL